MQNLDKNQKIIIGLIIVIVIIIITSYLKNNNSKLEIQDNITEYENIIENAENQIIIHITGAVVEEGIVKLTEGQRLSDAVEKAGGLTQDADVSKINLAYKLEDGQKIYIPYITDEVEENLDYIEDIYYEQTNIQKNSSLVNINKATKQELETLPGIGSATAEKIINYRDENGKFKTVDDIKNVSGIGDAKFETIKELICI